KSLDKIIEDKRQADTKPIRVAKEYIKQNYMKQISLEEVSSFVGFNSSYFSHLFKKESGKNFLEYLSETRMNKAKEFLKESNLSISVICERVGYCDIKHFTKSFKKIAGIKPNEYRKLYS
ncbi:two component AraC family transcriptional regulator, partial [Clostridium sartagoforme AAU1]